MMSPSLGALIGFSLVFISSPPPVLWIEPSSMLDPSSICGTSFPLGLLLIVFLRPDKHVEKRRTACHSFFLGLRHQKLESQTKNSVIAPRTFKRIRKAPITRSSMLSVPLGLYFRTSPASMTTNTWKFARIWSALSR
jgi:hypothetical protein